MNRFFILSRTIWDKFSSFCKQTPNETMLIITSVETRSLNLISWKASEEVIYQHSMWAQSAKKTSRKKTATHTQDQTTTSSANLDPKSRRVRLRKAIAHPQLTKALHCFKFQTKRNRSINLIQKQKLSYSLLHVLYPIGKWISCRRREFLSKKKIGRGINCY